MKKLILIAISGIIFSACAKDVKGPAEENQPKTISSVAGEGRHPVDPKAVRGIAKVVDSKDRGLGYVLQFTEFEWEVPISLPEEFKKPGAIVDVAYYHTDRQVLCPDCKEPKYYIEVVDIKFAPKDTPQ